VRRVRLGQRQHRAVQRRPLSSLLSRVLGGLRGGSGKTMVQIQRRTGRINPHLLRKALQSLIQRKATRALHVRTGSTILGSTVSMDGVHVLSHLTTRSLVSSKFSSDPLLRSRELIILHRGHLYRHHRIFQCPRCKELFSSQDEIDAHFIVLQGCDLSSEAAMEGITSNIEKHLRSRKKTYRHQTEENRWAEIYRLLFPGENIPSPCE
jgi:hypothetical protein